MESFPYPLSPKNYRPVALLPIISKVLEKVVFLQLVEYLDSNKLLSPNHHESRHSHNTATALIQMYDQWIEEMEEGKLVGVMMQGLKSSLPSWEHRFWMVYLPGKTRDFRAIESNYKAIKYNKIFNKIAI